MKSVSRADIRQVGQNLYEIPQEFRPDMRVPARFFTDETFLSAALEDHSLDQLANTATLPGVVGYALAMPDIHQGYGFPIGGVAATAVPHGIVSPGGVGYDINCGVRMLVADAQVDEIRPHIPRLADALYRHLPSGVGVKGHLHINKTELDAILRDGSQWALREGYARPEDVAHTEEQGRMAAANPDKVSKAAKERGQEQVGTLGSGNHFAEIDEVTDIFDEEAAALFGLRKGHVVFQIHCGSRGMGHQVATDYIETFQRASKKYGFELPDRQLVSAPLDSPEGEAYLAAMCAAANYAWANRQVLSHHAREAFDEALAGKTRKIDLRLLYDVAHNMAKIETHTVDGKQQRVCVHRKGATRAFGPGRPDVPEKYRHLGQPVLVPGSMGTASYVLIGAEEAMRLSFGSCCHGAGRSLSRAEAKRQVRGESLRGSLEQDGIVVRAGSLSGLAEEAPQAYKDIDRVVAVVESAGLARIVARVEPLAVIKG
jgi:tRNA-splicing ligase RtcB